MGWLQWGQGCTSSVKRSAQLHTMLSGTWNPLASPCDGGGCATIRMAGGHVVPLRPDLITRQRGVAASMGAAAPVITLQRWFWSVPIGFVVSVLKYTGPTWEQLVGHDILNEQNVGSAGLATVPPKVVKVEEYPDGMAFGGVP